MTKLLKEEITSCNECPYCEWEPDSDYGDGGEYYYCDHPKWVGKSRKLHERNKPMPFKISPHCPLPDWNVVDKFVAGEYKSENELKTK